MAPVARRFAIKARARGGLAREDAIHRGEHFRGGAEGYAEIHVTERLPRRLHLSADILQHGFEHAGVSTLKGIDRLLAVAHHEQRAPAGAMAAFAREEFFRQ